MARPGVFVFGMVFALVLAGGAVGHGQQQPDKKTLDALKKEVEALSKLNDAALAALAGPNDFDVTWADEDFMKGPKGQQFIPFTITLDPAKVPTPAMALYYRVISPAPPAPKGAKKVEGAFEGFESASGITTKDAKNPLRISRSFLAPAGTYDVYVVAKELRLENQKNAPAPKTAVFKKSVTVPDFWNGELATSSVIVYEDITPLTAPLNQAQQIERPYAMGMAEIVPFADLKLPKRAELSTLMFVYNPKGDSANKPDVTIEYNFCQIMPGNQPEPDEPCKPGEKFFNKTPALPFNAQTVDPQFDVTVHQIQAGQGVPLTAFPPGDYRLEIKVTDKLANKTITQDVNFSVLAS